ncbi:unnamed protein product [Discula destructiva]
MANKLLARVLLESVRAADTRQSAALCVFAVGIIIFSCRYSTTASLERPVVLSALSLLWTGLGLILYVRWKTVERVSGALYWRNIAEAQTRSELVNELAVPIALVLRAFCFRHTLWWAQCAAAHGGSTLLLPAVLATADWIWPKQHGSRPAATHDRSPSPPQGLWSHLSTATENQRVGGSRQRFPTRYAALAITWAFLADRLLRLTAQSTGMVCPTGTLWPAVDLVQLLVLGFDTGALFLLGRWRRGHQPDENPVPQADGVRLAGHCILAASTMLLLLGVTAPFATTSLREIATATTFRGLAMGNLLLDSLVAAGVLLSGLYLLAYLEPTTLALVGGAAFTSTHHNFEPITGHGISHSASGMAIIQGILAIACLALLSHDAIRLDVEASMLSTTEKPQHKKRLTACLSIITLLLGANYSRSIFSHPQDALKVVQSGQQASNDWTEHAGMSRNAHEAAAAYRVRYGLPPPPKFDQWHAFALAHHSPVLDIFDQIDADLKPFWGLTPAELRARTSHLLARTGLGIGGLRIRGGGVELGPNTPPTHMWMMEAWRDMIAPFAAKLPDMDLAFNLDDESRVAIPATDLAALSAKGTEPLHILSSSKAYGHPLRGWFSKAADPPWEDAFIKHEAVRRSKYFGKKKPRLGVFDVYIAPTCPTESVALRRRWWDGSRAMAQARGGVIASTPDLCGRPDLAQMHGFLVSPGGPGGLAVTQRAMPIFSQSRAGGFHDILVPSPWNYVDKVGVIETQDMEWKSKNDTVFWRGSGSDGFAEGNKWPGFMRARLVNLAKSLQLGLSFTRTDAPAVDVSFAGKFTHCDPAECRGMTSTFYGGHNQALEPATTDFQDHWAHRHLIDVDGAGFSGRFLPFVRSKSTVYRATLFRTWLDERVHPWKHYVPLDVSLSGLWDVVWLVTRKFVVKGSDSEVPLAQQVAADGHDWAAKALRKEDMQVYVFRLLLEWGRLVDDDREELGYDP